MRESGDGETENIRGWRRVVRSGNSLNRQDGKAHQPETELPVQIKDSQCV